MKLFRLSVTFIFGLLIAILFFSFNFPLLVIISIVFIYLLAFVVLPPIYTVYRSNNVKSIEKFLEANKKKPLFAYPLALAQGNQVEIEESLRAILAKHKQPYMQNVYKTILALHLKNIDAADTYAQRIDSEPLQSYYAAYVAAKQGDFETAASHKENVNVEWMLHSLHAIFAHEKGQLDEFEVESKKAVVESRGVQKFILVHVFKDM